MKSILVPSLALLLPTISLDAAVSDFLWARQAGGGGQDYGLGTAVDKDGNAFVTGYFSGQATFGPNLLSGVGGQDVFVAKYDSSGTLFWVAQAGGPGNEAGNGVATDAAGNCYITGVFQGSIGFGNVSLTSAAGSSFFIAKYNASGDLQWAAAGGGNLSDIATGIALDPSANVYVAGHTQGTPNGTFVAKFDNSGNLLWRKDYSGTADIVAAGISVDKDGDSLVTGYFSGQVSLGSSVLASAGGEDVFVFKSDAAGHVLWAVSGGGTGDDAATGVATDSSGNSYITGSFSGTANFGGTPVSTGSFREGFIARYDANGTLSWVQQLTGTGFRQDYPWAISVNSAGDCYITGQFFGTTSFGTTTLTSNDWDVFVSELDTQGQFLWATHAGGGSGEAGYGLAVDLSGNAVVTGVSSSSSVTFGSTILPNAGANDLFVVKLAGALVFPNPPTCDVTFSDGTFEDANWGLMTAFNSTAPGESGSSVQQVTTGGNPGSYRSTSVLFGHGELAVSELNSLAIYDPSVEGPVTSIDYSYDFIKLFPIGFGAIRYSLAILQNGVLYVDSGEAPGEESWTTHTHSGLHASDLFDMTATTLAGPNHPDFSVSAPPMQFGYLVANDNPAGPSSSTSGIDNWTVRLHVSDTAPPVVGQITAPVSPVSISSLVTASANFADACGAHSAIWDWGDGTSSTGTVTENGGSGSVVGAHSYSAPGVYQLTLTVTDDTGSVGTSIFQFIVVFDPNAGFVTGGGWIYSPAGAFPSDSTLLGKASFGFVSKYSKGATVPSGQTQFQFQAARFNFQSTGYDWLVISGGKAQYKGSGTVNNSGSYKFILTAVDGAITKGADRFRIKIWEVSTGTVVYDNQPGALDGADPSTVISGGDIVIHKQ